MAPSAGPYRDPTISGIADMKQLVVQGYPIGDGSGELTFHNPLLQIDAFHHASSRGHGAGLGAPSISAHQAWPLKRP